MIRLCLLVFGAVLLLAGCGVQPIEGKGYAVGAAPPDGPLSPERREGDGTRLDPAPPGTPLAVGRDWNVTLAILDVDAWDIIHIEDETNEPPAPGRKYVLGRLIVEYVGESSVEPGLDLTLTFLGSDGVTYGPSTTDSCGVVPDYLMNEGENLKTSNVVEGYMCWSVPVAVIREGLVVVRAERSGTEVFYDSGLP